MDIIPLGLITFSMLFEYVVDLPTMERPLNAISANLMWMKFLYYLRINKPTAHFINVLSASVSDMKVFFVVLFITIIMFSQSFYILS